MRRRCSCRCRATAGTRTPRRVPSSAPGASAMGSSSPTTAAGCWATPLPGAPTARRADSVGDPAQDDAVGVGEGAQVLARVVPVDDEVCRLPLGDAGAPEPLARGPGGRADRLDRAQTGLGQRLDLLSR